ncbi:N-carbamoyl-L-amino-acid hydrolase [Clohesyomyces aquaticus]|uniref:N-carbamoyl-L-amino-acid hydrolase n=1 Tax=Clohesyomyces aquaticus TaxID=1231657 RepID=A0A1Y1YRE9_9PLEO|nr:N-carbamoyl-L-amino-acid hydrolase [Clohesyomyces aquaticus]
MLATTSNAPLAEKLTVNGDRLWDDIHYTAKWSAPSPGGLTRLCADENDKLARDWFRDQVLELGADYKVNATGTQFALFPGEDESIVPIAMGSHLDSVATGGKFDGPLGVIGEGARFFPLLGSSIVYAGKSTVAEAHASKSNDHSGITMGSELAKIGYVGDGPNPFAEFPISAHFEIHVEQSTDLEKAGKPVGWVEGWQGMTWYSFHYNGENSHANTYPMYGRRDALVGAAKAITAIEALAYKHNGDTTVTNMEGLEAMGTDIETQIQGIGALHGLELEMKRDIHVPPGDFWPEAIDCVKRACGDKGIGSRTGTGHDSTMTTTLVPTAMVFVRGKDGISHSPKEWSDKEDCIEGALALGKAVLNFDELMKTKGSISSTQSEYIKT